MASLTVVKNILTHKNPFGTLDSLDTPESVDKKVRFYEEVSVYGEESQKLKEWDGSSPLCRLYCDMIQDFMYAPSSVGFTARGEKMAEMINMIDGKKFPPVHDLMQWIINEAEMTLGMINNSDKKVPIWKKGCSYKKGTYSFSAEDRVSSAQWVKLFIKALRGILEVNI